MRFSRVLLNSVKKTAPTAGTVKTGGSGSKLPVELYPLFAATAVAVCSACYFTYRHFAYDRQLRLWKNPNLSEVDEVLNEAVPSEKK